jgi:LuxR family transcriptional regulator, maltose regulon positive regulatory protein
VETAKKLPKVNNFSGGRILAGAKQTRGWRARISSPNPAKLTVPRLGRVLSRTRLLKQCDRLAVHKLVWIAAPGGSGKTTLLAEYLGSRKRAHLWYQVDAGDQDIASFFNNLATAVERGSRLKRKLTRFTPEYALGLPAFSRNFFRGLFARIKTPACIVFDNYQDVGETAVLDTVLAHAIDELPEGITIIALSRSTLPAALVRHDANGQIAHLDAAALALTTGEADAG